MKRVVHGMALGIVTAVLAMLIAGRAGGVCAVLGMVTGALSARLDESGRLGEPPEGERPR